MSNDYPVVLVHGLLGWGRDELGRYPYWGTARSVPSPLRRREASVGPLSSYHDRACELAWQLHGGTVDYGQDHSDRAGHRRYGRTYNTPLVGAWSSTSPVHLVGHSMGAPTSWLLQQLLEEDYFGWVSSAGWIKSVTSISGVLNGSTATYFFGVDELTGLLDQDSAAGWLGQALEVSIRATGGIFESAYDFDLDHWGLEQAPGEELAGFVERVGAAQLLLGYDNAAHSLSIQGTEKLTQYAHTFPNSYYLSYITEQTFAGYFSGHHYPEPLMNPILIPSALWMGHKEFDVEFYDGFNSSDWWHNDGAVSTYSQQSPRIGGHHPVGGSMDTTPLEPGRWYHETLTSTDHLDIAMKPQLGKVGEQKRFYTNLFQQLAELPA